MKSIYESIWTGYNILFEANAGDEMKKGVNFLETEYGIPREQGRQLSQMVRRACFDVFSNDYTLADKTKDPAVKAVLGLFIPVLRFLCEKFGPNLGQNQGEVYEFGERFHEFGVSKGVHPGPGGSIIDNAGGQVSLSDIMAASPIQQAPVPARAFSGKSRYTVVPITSHAEAMKYAADLPFCLTWNTWQYWNDYTSNGKFKCYFILRDDYQTIGDNYSSDHYSDDDDFARSAIACVVNSNGSIRSLFNRRNHVNNIYDEAQMSEFLCRPFREACPPYTNNESKEAIERNTELQKANGEYVRPAITRDNFIDVLNEEYNYMVSEETNPEGYENVYYSDIIGDICSSLSDTTEWSDDDSLQILWIRDSRDDNLYGAMFNIDLYNYSVTRLTEWLTEEEFDSTDIGLEFPMDYNGITGRMVAADNSDILFIFNRTLYKFDPDYFKVSKLIAIPAWVHQAIPLMMPSEPYGTMLCGIALYADKNYNRKSPDKTNPTIDDADGLIIGNYPDDMHLVSDAPSKFDITIVTPAFAKKYGVEASFDDNYAILLLSNEGNPVKTIPIPKNVQSKDAAGASTQQGHLIPPSDA